MNQPAVIEFDGVTIRYGKEVAVDGLTLSVAPGSVHALLGRNGAGKSSLVRVLAGQQRPARGSARLLGRDAWSDRAALMESAAIVAEDPDAPPEMTAGELARFCSRLYRRWDAGAVERRLARFEIPREVPFGRLSKGQRRQVLLAVSLGNAPEVLVLDDPTLGLDVVARRELLEELIGELAERGTTVLMTTHDLAGVESIADRVSILERGRLVLDEEVETLKARFRRIRYATAPHAANLPEEDAGDSHEGLRLTAVRQWSGGTEAVAQNYDELLLERFRAASGARDVEVMPMPLEEIFVSLTDASRRKTS